MKKFPAYIAIPILAGFMIGAAGAASLSITSGPSFTTPDVTSTITGQLIDGDLIKISGNATFIQPASPLTYVTMTLSGTFEVQRGEAFFLDYEFTGMLTGLASVPYSLQVDAWVDTMYGPITVDNVVEDDGVFAPGTSFKSRSDYAELSDLMFDIAGESPSGSFSVLLRLDTSLMAPGDVLSLEIPTDSIDLSVAPIPEPTSLAFGGLAVLAAGFRRRRRSA